MRIITGTRRGKRLKTLDGSAVRPTPDHVKEALFNILQFNVEGRVFLDLFAGSGQIGLEALSRGAQRAVFVDSARAAASVVEENIRLTGFEDSAKLCRMDFAAFLAQTPERFDVAFLDPPYRTGLLQQALELVPAVMNRGGVILAEHPSDEAVPDAAGAFIRVKDYRYGKIMLTAYRHQSLLAEQE